MLIPCKHHEDNKKVSDFIAKQSMQGRSVACTWRAAGCFTMRDTFNINHGKLASDLPHLFFWFNLCFNLCAIFRLASTSPPATCQPKSSTTSGFSSLQLALQHLTEGRLCFAMNCLLIRTSEMMKPHSASHSLLGSWGFVGVSSGNRAYLS